MNKETFLEAVNIGAACLTPGKTPSRHLLDMLVKRLEIFREDYPELIKLILPEPHPRQFPSDQARTVDTKWLHRFCSCLYGGLYMLELEAVEFQPPPPPPPEPTHWTVAQLKKRLDDFDDDTPVRGHAYGSTQDVIRVLPVFDGWDGWDGEIESITIYFGD